MYCSKCGKALGTNSIKCPFCGTMISNSQVKESKQYREKEKELQRVKLISEQYGQELGITYNEKTNENKILGGIIILAVLLLIIVIVLLIIL